MPVFTDGTPQFTRFLFEGAGAGSGQLLLTVSQGSSLVAETAVWIELLDIRDMYERGFIHGVQLTHPAMRDNTNASTFGVERRLESAPDETEHLIVYVHGFNNDYWQFGNYADTFFKRLYWQGYRGRFAALKWPTLLGLHNYNKCEYIAFRSAAGAAGFFTELRSRFPDYSINVVT